MFILILVLLRFLVYQKMVVFGADFYFITDVFIFYFALVSPFSKVRQPIAVKFRTVITDQKYAKF